jgi:DNA-binding response OmpR family regulator
VTRVLLLEDEPLLRSGLASLLRREGYEVHEAGGSREALEAAEKAFPDVLVVDWLLKDDLDGVSVARYFRERSPQIRVVLITGFPIDELTTQVAGDPSEFAYLEKPFRAAQLVAAIRSQSPTPS